MQKDNKIFQNFENFKIAKCLIKKFHSTLEKSQFTKVANHVIKLIFKKRVEIFCTIIFLYRKLNFWPTVKGVNC
jgi:hypothetical protein